MSGSNIRQTSFVFVCLRLSAAKRLDHQAYQEEAALLVPLRIAQN
jgi:hypothetical protein